MWLKPGDIVDDPEQRRRDAAYVEHNSRSHWHEYRVGVLPEWLGGRWRWLETLERRGIYYLPEDAPRGQRRAPGWVWEFRDVQPKLERIVPQGRCAWDETTEQWIHFDEAGRRSRVSQAEYRAVDKSP